MLFGMLTAQLQFTRGLTGHGVANPSATSLLTEGLSYSEVVTLREQERDRLEGFLQERDIELRQKDQALRQKDAAVREREAVVHAREHEIARRNDKHPRRKIDPISGRVTEEDMEFDVPTEFSVSGSSVRHRSASRWHSFSVSKVLRSVCVSFSLFCCDSATSCFCTQGDLAAVFFSCLNLPFFFSFLVVSLIPQFYGGTPENGKLQSISLVPLYCTFIVVLLLSHPS
jgi:hypothetical protein